jgi:hypothetical protein
VQSGFNTNVRYRGVVFHVQTEDSGLSHPHFITHLYYRGTILASEKTGYADRVGSANLAHELRGLMETQHARMLTRLRSGEFDSLIEERLQGAGSEARAPGAAGATAAAPEPRGAAREPAAPGGEGRPLDELILDYLVESARKRKRRAQ